MMGNEPEKFIIVWQQTIVPKRLKLIKKHHAYNYSLNTDTVYHVSHIDGVTVEVATQTCACELSSSWVTIPTNTKIRLPWLIYVIYRARGI